jgi:lysophospholipase L1-like esterase
MSRLAALLFALPLTIAAVSASADDVVGDVVVTRCPVPPALVAVGAPLSHSGARVRAGEKLTIVAIGSSSTQGVGASDPALTYPSLLQAELRHRYPQLPVRVVNRGKGGEDAREEMARLDRDVLAEYPDLVIWQVGTNAVLRRDDLAADGDIIERGVERLKQAGSDVVLMDLQDAPRVTARPAYAEMERVLARVAKANNVGLFHRFDIMRYWRSVLPPSAPGMIGPDNLHMSDRGYGCLATDLAEALALNWSTYGQPGGPSQIANLRPQFGNRPLQIEVAGSRHRDLAPSGRQ